MKAGNWSFQDGSYRCWKESIKAGFLLTSSVRYTSGNTTKLINQTSKEGGHV